MTSLIGSLESMNWSAALQSLDDRGYARLSKLLTKEECGGLIAVYGDDALFRKRIDMAKYRFGLGEYKYFQSPLPPLIEALRTELYDKLAPAANRWLVQSGGEPSYPAALPDFLRQCGEQGQARPTPLLLKYEAGGYNCLHQDLYGDVYFPFQVVVALNAREADYTGGEFLLTEQRPRAQSRGHALTLDAGEGLVFPTHHRPVAGKRGFYKAVMRHGVSTIHTGTRYSLGIIFHNAL